MAHLIGKVNSNFSVTVLPKILIEVVQTKLQSQHALLHDKAARDGIPQRNLL